MCHMTLTKALIIFNIEVSCKIWNILVFCNEFDFEEVKIFHYERLHNMFPIVIKNFIVASIDF